MHSIPLRWLKSSKRKQIWCNLCSHRMRVRLCAQIALKIVNNGKNCAVTGQWLKYKMLATANGITALMSLACCSISAFSSYHYHCIASTWLSSLTRNEIVKRAHNANVYRDQHPAFCFQFCCLSVCMTACTMSCRFFFLCFVFLFPFFPTLIGNYIVLCYMCVECIFAANRTRTQIKSQAKPF